MKSALPRALFFVLALRKLLRWRGAAVPSVELGDTPDRARAHTWRGASELGVHGLLGAISRG